MSQIIITAGGQRSTFSSDDYVSVVNSNGQTQRVTAGEVEVGDVIINGYDRVTVTSIDSAVDMNIDYPKGTEEQGGCFPAEAKVYTKDGGHMPISHVTTGTLVLAILSRNPIFSPVYLMAHADPSTMMKCVQIITEGATLELSEGHFVVIVDSHGQERYVTARKVKRGDMVKVLDESKEAFRLSPVTSLGLVERRGRFAPFTLAGTVVVEGVAASCYEETCRVSPDWAHVLLGPVRWAWGLSPSTFAMLSGPRDLKGLPVWLSWLMPLVLPYLPNMNSA